MCPVQVLFKQFWLTTWALFQAILVNFRSFQATWGSFIGRCPSTVRPVFPVLVFQLRNQATEPHSDNLLNRIRNPSEPYSDKVIPRGRALRRLPCKLGSQVEIHRKSALSQLGTVHKTVLGQLLILETGGILFREYCYGEENSLSLTEFYGKLGEFCDKLGEFVLAHK